MLLKMTQGAPQIKIILCINLCSFCVSLTNSTDTTANKLQSQNDQFTGFGGCLYVQ